MIYRAFGGHVHWEAFFISAILGKVLGSIILFDKKGFRAI